MRVTSARQLFAGILGLAGCLGGPLRGEGGIESLEDLREVEARVRKVVAKALPATVSLFSTRNGSSGSGVIVSEDGIIMTAGHVILGLDEVTVVFPDGKQEVGKVIGANREKDAALVRLQGDGPWPAVEIGDSDALKVGSFVVSLGHAGGYDPVRTPPVRFGRVVGRNPLGYLVTDCTLIGGDSGGPLFDLDGRVVGIHSSIGESLEANHHRGSNEFVKDWDRMMTGKRWGRLIMDPMMNPDRPVMGFGVEGSGRGGVLVGEVAPGSPAATAGLRPGDVVRKIEGRPIRSYDDIQRLLVDRRPGHEVTVTYLRGNREIHRDMKLVRLADVYGEQ